MLISGLAEANATDPETQFTLLRGYAIICNLIGVVTVHGIVARVLIALLIGHIGAALYHQFIKRDRLLARIGLDR
jgi:cytochrome b561